MSLVLVAAALAAPTPSVSQPALQTAVRPRVPTLVLTGENAGRDWRYTSTFVRQVLAESGKFRPDVSLYPDGSLLDPATFERYDLLVVDYDGARWGEQAEQAFVAALRSGTDLVVLNKSGRSFDGWDAWRGLFGTPGQPSAMWEAFDSLDLAVDDAEHPVTAGLEPIRGLWDVMATALPPLEGSGLRTLLSAGGQPVLAAGSLGEGRVVHLRLGNVVPGDGSSWPAVQDPQFQQLLLRSAEWAATGAVSPNVRVAPNTLTAADRAAGWKLLFDGDTTSGWEGLGDGLPEDRWVVENGALHVLPGDDGSEIVFEEIFERFELELDWKVAEGGDPGVLHHLDERGGTRLGMDADAAHESLRILRPAGEFNHARVVATEDHVEHWLNGVHLMTFDISAGAWAEAVRGENLRANLEAHPDLERLPLARIALRGGGIDVWMRNIKIRQLPGPGAASAPAPDPTVRLFNGADLADWVWIPRQRRAANAFSVRDGVLVSAGRPDAFLRTAQPYQDYLVELEYRFTDRAADTGLLFHLTSDELAGEGRVWPRSIEVRLGPNRAGDLRNWGDVPLRYVRNIEIGIVQRTHDNDNPPGEWNRLEVLHAGGAFRVRINGEVVNAVTDVEDAPGHIAIKAEGPPLEFRNVRLTPVGGG